VNGQLVPLIVMRPGEVQRWRLIDAGVDESLPMETNAGPLDEIATDGNALGRIDTWRRPIDLEPGYRSDVLFKAPMKKGRYYLISGEVPAKDSLLAVASGASIKNEATGTKPRYAVAIDVTGDPNDMPLPTAAELKGLAPYKPITRDELNGANQSVTFIDRDADCSKSGPCKPCNPEFKVHGKTNENCTFKFMVDWHVFPAGKTRTLKLGTASQWTLAVSPLSAGHAHPFHVHVNAFEMVREGPNDKDEIVWKDTLMVHQFAPRKYRTILSRYEDFAGAFVLHCHILPHEDAGMMQKVVIVP